jgi:hypothetical protein
MTYLVNVAVDAVVQNEGHQQLLNVMCRDVELLRYKRDSDARVGLYQPKYHLWHVRRHGINSAWPRIVHRVRITACKILAGRLSRKAGVS